MGSDAGRPNERPARRVRISYDYWIGRIPVTQAQYREVVGRNPSAFRGPSGECNEGNLPVESVSWYDAMRYCELLTRRERKAGRLPEGYVYRLPTEAEWEYAARGGHVARRDYAYAGSNDLDEVARHLGNSSRLMGVGTLNANALGIYDMSGNVWEWTYDGYQDDYGGLPGIDPVVASEDSLLRVRRGGSFLDSVIYDPLAFRVAYRYASLPRATQEHTGFRVVLAPPLRREGNERKAVKEGSDG